MMRLRSLSQVALGVMIAAVLVLCGCDSGGPASTAPPTSDAEDESGSPLYLYFILPAEHTPLIALYEQAAMLAAGEEQAILRLEWPEQGAPASRQVELIEKAVADGATSIVIVAQDPKVVAPALVEARAKGVSVVLLDRPVEVEGEPLTLVTQPPIAESVRPMIEKVIKAAEDSKLSPDGPAVLIVHRDPNDPDLAVRTSALREGLKSAGLTKVTELSFTEPGEESRTFYAQIARMDPSPSMIFANDDDALATVARKRAASVRDGGVRRMLGGLVSQPRSMELISFNQAAGLVDMDIRKLVVRAVRAAVEQSRGVTPPPKIVVDRPLTGASDLHNPIFLGESQPGAIGAPGGR